MRVLFFFVKNEGTHLYARMVKNGLGFLSDDELNRSISGVA
jgi:hypothetical protein